MPTRDAEWDEECIDIVEMWLAPLEKGENELGREKLADEFEAKRHYSIGSPSAQERKRYAFENGLVRLAVDRKPPHADRNEDAEDKLTLDYGLSGGEVVVDDHSERPTSSTNDAMHRQLGYALCKSMCEGASVFRQDATAGIGSGRAIHYFVDSFRYFKKNKIVASGVKLMSLTGTIYPEAPNQGQLYDADINTVEFARYFSQATTVRTVSFPMAHDDIPAVRRNTWLHDRDDERFWDPATRHQAQPSAARFEQNLFENHVPDVCIVGLGVLEEGHRLWKEMRQGAAREAGSTMLDPIRPDLTALIDICEGITKRAKDSHPHVPYFPCADVCHRLFFIGPPEGFSITPAEEDSIKNCITAVNRHMLTVTKTQLSKVANTILIAGGVDKMHAIKNLLRRNNPIDGQDPVPAVVKTICTDHHTAKYLND